MEGRHEDRTETDRPRRQGRCPSCGRPTEAVYRPFCSRRCADLDLSRWLCGLYAIPVVEEDGGLPETDLWDAD